MRVPPLRRRRSGLLGRLPGVLALAGALSALRRGGRSGRSLKRPALVAAAGGVAAALAAILARRRSREAEPLGEVPPLEDASGAATPPAEEMAPAADMTGAVQGSDASTAAESSQSSSDEA